MLCYLWLACGNTATGKTTGIHFLGLPSGDSSTQTSEANWRRRLRKPPLLRAAVAMSGYLACRKRPKSRSVMRLWSMSATHKRQRPAFARVRMTSSFVLRAGCA